MDPGILRQFAAAARGLPQPQRAQLARNAIIHVLAGQVGPLGNEGPDDKLARLYAQFNGGMPSGFGARPEPEAGMAPGAFANAADEFINEIPQAGPAPASFAPPGPLSQPGSQYPRSMPDQSVQGWNGGSVRPGGEPDRPRANRQSPRPEKASNRKRRDYALTSSQKALRRLKPRTVAEYKMYRLRYWTLRWEENGEEFAKRAIGVVRNEHFWPRQANDRLNIFWRERYGRDITELDAQKIGWDLVKAHADAVELDYNTKDGIPGLLSREDVRDFHHKVFRKWGLSPETFGGDHWLAPIIGLAYDWCPGCDTHEKH